MSKNIRSLSARMGVEQGLFSLYPGIGIDSDSSSDDVEKIAVKAGISRATVLGASSFYDFLRQENQGKKVHVCCGTSCMTSGRSEALLAKLNKRFDQEEIGEACCYGRCHEGGSFQYEGRNFSGKTAEEIEAILDGDMSHSPDEYHVGSSTNAPLLTAPFPGMKEYVDLLKQAFVRDPQELIAQLRTSGLRGRGGAGFPAGIKLEMCANVPSAQKYVVCNADEGDPCAYTDRYLLEQRPHSVLFGMAAAGYAVGANIGILYVRAEYPDAFEALAAAIEDFEKSGIEFNFEIVRGAGAYICGEETALLSSIEGLRPEVRIRPPYPVQEGLFGKPTVVNNVETFACIYPILSLGGENYAKIGTERSAGSKLVSLDANFETPGVYEVEMGTPLPVILDELGGGFRKPVKAIQIGGPLGGIAPAKLWPELTLDFESFADHNLLLGHGSFAAIPKEFPIIEYLWHLFAFTAGESCGKCYPCRYGAYRGMELIAGAADRGAKIDRTLFRDLLETLELGSLCALGGGLPLPIRNALEYFEPELAGHFTGGDDK